MALAAELAFAIGCIITFFPVSKLAGCLLIPYFLWLTFATAFNYSMVCLNGCYFKVPNNATD